MQGDYNNIIVLIAIGILILFIGVINYINIYTVIILRRGREFGIKKVFGAGGNNIFIQLFAENLLLTGFAIILALSIVSMANPFISNVLQLETVLAVRFDLFLLLVLALSLPLLTTLYPFFRYCYSTVVSSIHSLDKIRGAGSLRRILLSFQYIITIVLIIVSLFFVKQLRFMLNADLGYRTKDVIKVSFQKFQTFHKTIFISAENYVKNADGSITLIKRDENLEAWRAQQAKEKQTAEDILQKIKACPLFLDWTFCDSPNEFKIYTFPFNFLEGDYKEIKLERTSENWLRLFNIQLIEGHFWDDTMEGGETAFIVTESVMKLFGITDFKSALLQPERELWKEGNPPYRIVGVVKDINYLHLSQKSVPVAFYFGKESAAGANPLKASIIPGRKQEAIEFLRNLHEEMVGGEFSYSFLEDEIREMYKEDAKIATVYSFFTFIAIFISVLGLFSMSLFDIQQRRKEIAIRKINGATVAEIIRILLKKYFHTLSISFVIATPVALFAIYRYLEDFAHKASVSWWLFAVAAIITAGISMLTLIYQTQKAANQNPAEVVKTE